MYFPATYSFFPVWNVGKLVITMHDALPLAHPELVFPTTAGRLSWRLKEWTAARMADRVVTVSEASRRDLADWVPGGLKRIRLITEGPDAVFRPRDDPDKTHQTLCQYQIPTDRRFLLYVGGLSPHKNLPRLVEAFATIPDGDVHLVLVGDLGDVFHTDVPAIRAAITRHGIDHRVHLTGFVPDDDLVFLYNRASALVQPSLLEGFGLPAVEAMACGTPVIASRAGSLPEVVGDAGIFFDPRDTALMAEALIAFLVDTDASARLGKRALERARLFTWDRAARMLLDCFDELADDAAASPALARGA
jgi:glycosyltransferase involved in cell wall biosynthesis